MTLLDLLLLMLATYYVSASLTQWYGPYDIFAHLRTRLPLGGLTTCIKCMALWVALALWGLYLWQPMIVYPFAIAGGMLMLRSHTGVDL